MSANPIEDPVATMDLLELVSDAERPRATQKAKPPVKLIAGQSESLNTATTRLLLTRLRAVAALLLLIYGVILAWALIGGGLDATGSASVFRNISCARLAMLAGLLALLMARPAYSQSFLRGVEYALFAALTLLWVYGRYQSLLSGFGGAAADMLLDGRTATIGLFLLLVVHGIFLPHHWSGTARVVLTMALAPAVVLVIFEARHPELIRQAGELTSWPYVGTNILIVLVGAILATFTSYTLNNLREEVHEARRFGQYQLVSKLGSGGMGDVYLAEHVLMKRPCALKLIHADSAANPLALSRFEREVKATASLTHPHTIEIYDYGHTNDGTFYYVMEYLPGLSLHELLAKYGPLPPGRAIYLLRQACSALAEAHAAGLIHRDLKPGNIYISERGGLCDFVKVLDFGLVKVTQDPSAAQLTADHTISGTPLYMAPEQALGAERVDNRSDLYALGAIGYQMLSGRPPFPGENPMALLIAHAREPVPKVSSIRSDAPADLEAVLMRCLAKSPEDRYSDALELEQALASCAAVNEWNAQQAAVWWHKTCAPT